MRWQRQVEAALDRFCDLTGQPDRFREIVPFVVPTFSLGADVVDAERNLYMVGGSFVAAAGQFPTLAIGFPNNTDCELVAARAWGTAAQLVAWEVGAIAGLPGLAGLPPLSSSSTRRISASTVTGGSSATNLGAGAGRPVATMNGNVPAEVPGLPARWRNGISLQGTTAASTVRFLVAWREGSAT